MKIIINKKLYDTCSWIGVLMTIVCGLAAAFKTVLRRGTTGIPIGFVISCLAMKQVLQQPHSPGVAKQNATMGRRQ